MPTTAFTRCSGERQGAKRSFGPDLKAGEKVVSRKQSKPGSANPSSTGPKVKGTKRPAKASEPKVQVAGVDCEVIDHVLHAKHLSEGERQRWYSLGSFLSFLSHARCIAALR